MANMQVVNYRFIGLQIEGVVDVELFRREPANVGYFRDALGTMDADGVTILSGESQSFLARQTHRSVYAPRKVRSVTYLGDNASRVSLSPADFVAAGRPLSFSRRIFTSDRAGISFADGDGFFRE